MKKRGTLLMTGLFLILCFGAGVWWFVEEVENQLWNGSVRTVTENTHQGVNALRLRFEMDFNFLDRIWEGMGESDSPEDMLAIYSRIEPDMSLYLTEQQPEQGWIDSDSEAYTFLEGTLLERGIIDSHINPATGENVFNIFVRGFLAEGTSAFLVKEYRTQEIAHQFTLPFYDDTGYSYLINRTGTIMVRPENENSTGTTYNLFDMLLNQGNDAVKVEAFKDSVYGLKTGWCRLTYDEVGLVFCYEPLGADSDWLLVSIIPEPVITAQTSSILQKTLFFSGTAIGIICMLVMTFYWNKMHENEVHTSELTEALETADKANRAKGRFLADMSHDIRTPLNAILGMAAVGQKNIGDEEKVEDCLKKIEKSGVQLLTLASDVLDLSQIEQGELIIKEEPMCLPQVFEETVGLIRRKAAEAGLTLECTSVQVKDQAVMGDALRIRQILLNIISNAIKYTPAGGRVTLKLTQTESKESYGIYCFSCADTGIGMEPEFRERMFVAFERARNTTASKIPGTGVGLTITKNLLDAMGGTIEAQSTPGKGSVFTISFPLKIQRDVAEEEKKILANRDMRVLVVEDNELNMEIMEEFLKAADVQVEKAADGKEAVDMVKASKEGYYDLILMDIQMPVMDGYEATRKIRMMDRKDVNHLPIYAVSANALAEDVKNSLDAGMDGHIAKPVDPEVIEKVLVKIRA